MTFPLWFGSARDRGGAGDAKKHYSKPVLVQDSAGAAAPAESVHSTHRGAQQERDRAWVAALRTGDLHAFEAMYAEYFPLLWRLAVRSVNEAEAEDVVHDVFSAMWERRASAKCDDYLGPYLVAALRSHLRERFRHDRVVRSAESRMDPELPPGLSDARFSPEADLTLQELESAVVSALQQLPERQRDALVLRWYHRMSYEEIAQALHISVLAARQLVSRTQRLVRPLLDRFR